MIKLLEKFSLLNRSIKDSQYPVSTDGAIKAYMGVSKDGFYRISFLSTQSIGVKGVTKAIAIVQGESGDGNYWTCFDLKNDDLLSAFCSFGEDMISCIRGIETETIAASRLRLRYSTWLALFRKTRTPMSEEKARGLYGELYFLKTHMLRSYDERCSIEAWGGPEQFNKDFSINDTWFEIKTIGVGSAVAKISSLAQLSSGVKGHLIIIRTEEMAETYKGEDASINELIQNILALVRENELKDLFLDKVTKYGYDLSDDIGNKKYVVKKIEKYCVDETFPVLRESDIKSSAVNNVSYELILKLIAAWMEK